MLVYDCDRRKYDWPQLCFNALNADIYYPRRFAICIVRLSMYICSVSLPETSLSTSPWTPLAFANIA